MGEITKSKSEASLGFGGLPPTIKQLAVRILLAAACGPKTTNNTTSTEDAPPFHSNPAGFHSNPPEQFFIQILQSRCPPRKACHMTTQCVCTPVSFDRGPHQKNCARIGLGGLDWLCGVLWPCIIPPTTPGISPSCVRVPILGEARAVACQIRQHAVGGSIPVISHATAAALYRDQIPLLLTEIPARGK
ncbi:MAG: hypothetical protein GY846_20655 [Deltaproteobacteria bacterium]|nr:hypothetical protein [Deltaproteobacteria bacterium]